MSNLKVLEKSNTLVVETVMGEAHAFIHLDDNIHGSVMGYTAKVQWTPGLALILKAKVPVPPILSASCFIRNGAGGSYFTTSLSDISLGDLSKVKEVEFRFFVVPMCQVMED